MGGVIFLHNYLHISFFFRTFVPDFEIKYRLRFFFAPIGRRKKLRGKVVEINRCPAAVSLANSEVRIQYSEFRYQNSDCFTNDATALRWEGGKTEISQKTCRS